MNPRVARYRELLLAWNEKINLIGPEAKQNIDAHLDEALAAAALLEPQGEVLDFGSGGGLPAIPMAIVSAEARFHLVEADQKKWAFLKHAVRELGLNAQVHGDRLARVLERLPEEQQFDLVVSRAVGSPEQWLPLLARRLADRARVGLFQGQPAVGDIPGFRLQSAHPLPRGESNYLVVLTFHVEHL